jgi:uncharacterized membrane-anchored protein
MSTLLRSVAWVVLLLLLFGLILSLWGAPGGVADRLKERRKRKSERTR